MAKLVQYVIHKETKEKRLIKVKRFNPDLHEPLPGAEGEIFRSQAGKNSTASGIVVPTGVQPKVPSAEEIAAKEAAKKKADEEAAKAAEVEKAKADADAKAAEEVAEVETVKDEKGQPVLTAEDLDEDYTRKDLDKMALDLGYPEKDVADAPKKAVVIEMILKGEYKA